MTFSDFLHICTTSRYTRRLEAEIAFLVADRERMQRDIDAFIAALSPQMRQQIEIRKAEKQLAEPKKDLRSFSSF